MKIIEDKWTIINFCIQDNRFFRYKDEIYQQKRDLPMGSSASLIVADVVMEGLLYRCLNNCDIMPRI